MALVKGEALVVSSRVVQPVLSRLPHVDRLKDRQADRQTHKKKERKTKERRKTNSENYIHIEMGPPEYFMHACSVC